MDKIALAGCIILSLVFFIVMNAGVVLWGNSKDEKVRQNMSESWHIMSFLMRGLLTLSLFLVFPKFYFFLIAVTLCWPIYNVGIALLIGKPWWYLNSKQTKLELILVYSGYVLVLIGLIITAIKL